VAGRCLTRSRLSVGPLQYGAQGVEFALTEPDVTLLLLQPWASEADGVADLVMVNFRGFLFFYELR
jgi:hypothetical protein